MQRTTVLPDELYDSTDKLYTHAIVADGTFYMSGQVATDSEGNIVGETIQEQTRQAFDNIGVILDEIGLAFTDVVKVTSYLTNIHGDYDGYKTVFGDVFDEPYPCHTMLGVDALASEDFLVELEVEAPLPEDHA